MNKWHLTKTDVLALIFILLVVGVVVWASITTGGQPANIFNTGPDNLFIQWHQKANPL